MTYTSIYYYLMYSDSTWNSKSLTKGKKKEKKK